tara:strand:+ start:610 stop:732 length:123 start_codon:yes stop_codon:yes gene_type:complete
MMGWIQVLQTFQNKMKCQDATTLAAFFFIIHKELTYFFAL